MSRFLIAHLGRDPEFATVSGTRVVWSVDDYEREYAALRGGAGLADLSGSGPLRVRGPHALEVLNRALTRDVEFLAPEQTQTSLLLDADGRPIDVVIVLAVADNEYLLQCGRGRAESVARALAEAAGHEQPEIEDLSESFAVFSVEGPYAWRAVGAVFGEDYVSLAYESLLTVEVNDVEALIARIGVTGEYGYTVFVPQEAATAVWRALAAHTTMVGDRALETAMIEVRQPLLHREADEHSTVLTTGLNWLVDLAKPDFVGREAVLWHRQAYGGARPIGFGVVAGRVEPGEDLFVEVEHVGRVRHVVDSPGTGGQLGLAQVDREWQASRLEFSTAAGARVRTLSSPYVTPTSWDTPIEA
ncbi:hypothetical protein ACWEOZ_38835 [Actinoplanes sp. NPDC004185]